MRMNRINRIVLTTIAFLALRANAGETGVEKRTSAAPRFTLEEAILTALQQNPSILIARQEIERTKGLYIEMRAAALPQVNATGMFQDLDPHLTNFTGDGGTGGGGFNFTQAERTYTLEIAATQVIFSGGRVPYQIRSADFQRDSSYYA